jgi:hypothetical protein
LTAIVDSSLFLTETSLWYDWKEKKSIRLNLKTNSKNEKEKQRKEERERERRGRKVELAKWKLDRNSTFTIVGKCQRQRKIRTRECQLSKIEKKDRATSRDKIRENENWSEKETLTEKTERKNMRLNKFLFRLLSFANFACKYFRPKTKRIWIEFLVFTKNMGIFKTKTWKQKKRELQKQQATSNINLSNTWVWQSAASSYSRNWHEVF